MEKREVDENLLGRYIAYAVSVIEGKSYVYEKGLRYCYHLDFFYTEIIGKYPGIISKAFMDYLKENKSYETYKFQFDKNSVLSISHLNGENLRKQELIQERIWKDNKLACFFNDFSKKGNLSTQMEALKESGFGYIEDLIRYFEEYKSKNDEDDEKNIDYITTLFLKKFFKERFKNIDFTTLDKSLIKLIDIKFDYDYKELGKEYFYITNLETLEKLAKEKYNDLIRRKIFERIDEKNFEYARDLLLLICKYKKINKSENINEEVEENNIGQAIAYTMSMITGTKYEYRPNIRINPSSQNKIENTPNIEVPGIIKEGIQIEPLQLKYIDGKKCLNDYAYPFLGLVIPFKTQENEEINIIDALEENGFRYLKCLVNVLEKNDKDENRTSIEIAQLYLKKYYKRQIEKINFEFLDEEFIKMFECEDSSLLKEKTIEKIENMKFDYVRRLLNLINKYQEFQEKYTKQRVKTKKIQQKPLSIAV